MNWRIRKSVVKSIKSMGFIVKSALKNKSKFSIHFIFLTWLKNQNQTELM